MRQKDTSDWMKMNNKILAVTFILRLLTFLVKTSG